MLLLPLAILPLTPLAFGSAVPPIPRNAERFRSIFQRQQHQSQLTLAFAEQLLPAPQFIGCVSRNFIAALVPGEKGEAERSARRGQIETSTSKESCTSRCTKNAENKYAYFNAWDSECFCSREQFPSSSDYRDAKDDVTYLPSPFTFTSCFAPPSSASASASAPASVRQTFKASSQQFCFDTCNATPNANIASLTPTYDAEQDWWFFQCSCSAEGEAVRELTPSAPRRSPQMAFGGWGRQAVREEVAKEMRVEAVEAPERCGLDSVFRYERPILD